MTKLPRPRLADATLVVPPTRPGSVGDEAMMIVCMEHLQRRGQPFAIADFAPADRWPEEPPGTPHVDLSGFFGARYVRTLPTTIRALRGFNRVWCLGADVIDGHYSEVGSLRRVTLVGLAARLGLDASILGCSFNEAPSALVVEALRELPGSVRLHARDPRSHARMIEKLGRPAHLVADLAFGLEPSLDLDSEQQAMVDWIHLERGRGRRVIGLNLSHRAFESTGHDDISKAVDVCAKALTTLLERHSDVSILVIPHDYRSSRKEISDPELLAAVVRKVDPSLRERILVSERRLSARFVKRLAGECDAVLSGRMHLVIAALGGGTPASGISYQGKLAGLYDHFGLQGLEIDPSDALSGLGLLRALERLLEDQSVLRARIDARLPFVEALQQSNFETGLPPADALRLLVISPEATHPVNKGNRKRIMDLCEQAEQLGWEVHLAHIQTTACDRALLHEHWGARYHPLPYRYPVDVAHKVARRLRGAIKGDYELRIDDWYDTETDAHLFALQRRYRFDAVMVEYAHQSKAFEVFDEGVLKILDTHDELAHRFARQKEFGQRRTGFSTTPEEESIGLGRADVVLAIQDVERERFQSRTTSEVVTVGHRVDIIEARPKPFEARLLFLGSRNQANVDAIEYFLREVWPLVSDRAKLLIAGSICELIDVPEGVEEMPVVDDLSLAYDAADLVVVPVRFGTGLKIKTIEALGRGKPTISSTVGAEGLESAHGSALMIANEPDELAEAILQLIEDPHRREALARAALDFARGWSAKSEEAFRSVLGRVRVAQAAD